MDVPLVLLALWTCCCWTLADTKGSFPLRPAYSLYSTGHGGAHGHAARATSRHRNWCAFVVTKTVSCVVEDGVETYVKPDYHPCTWNGGQCSRVVVYRTYMRPRYKVAYKMVTELEWKCCHGYSGVDCGEGPAVGSGTQISTTKPQPRPGQGGAPPNYGQIGGPGTSYGQGGGAGGAGYGQGRGGGSESHGGQNDSHSLSEEGSATTFFQDDSPTVPSPAPTTPPAPTPSPTPTPTPASRPPLPGTIIRF